MFLEFPDQPTLYQAEDQFMLGNSLLVKAIINTADETETTIDLPKNAIWYDFYTGEKILPTGRIKVPVGLENIPVFAKGGSIIPTRTRVRRSATLMVNDPFTLLVFLTEEGISSGRVYIDDGASFKYQGGDYLSIQISFKDGILVVSNVEGDGHKLASGLEKIRVFGVKETPKKVTLLPTKRTLDFKVEQPGIVDIKAIGISLNDTPWSIQIQ